MTKTTKLVLVQEDKGEGQDPFLKRLPYDLIILIFDKIRDAKFLCRSCSLVSKHFSSLVYQAHIVSFKISKVQMSQLKSLDFDRELFDHIGKCLEKFTSMRSLYLELDRSRSHAFRKEALLKCNYNTDSSTVVLVSAQRLDRSDDGDENVLDSGQAIGMFETILMYYLDVTESFWFSFMKKLVPYLPGSLQNIVVRHSKKRGRIDFGKGMLVEMRNQNTELVGAGLKVRGWCAPVIKLPISDSDVWTVFLFIGKDKESDLDDHLLVKEALDGEEEIYAQAARELLKKEHFYEESVGSQEEDN